MSSPVICLMGPTASGKTGLAIELAKQLDGEVVSVDSALIYRDMNIGTAKPDTAEQAGIVHHLIDICSPEQSYSVAQFIEDVNHCVKDIQARNKQAILAGGTMMYFNALLNGLNELPQSDQKVRARIQHDIEQQGLDAVHATLAQVDPVCAEAIHPNDPQRIMRALEVYYISGQTMSQWRNKEKTAASFDYSAYSIMPLERSTLHQLIELRFDTMLKNGFIEEVKELLTKYELEPDMPSMRSVGYRQVWQYLRGELSYEEMRERGIIATRQLAKRQLTWLRGFDNLTGLTTGNVQNLSIVVENLGATHINNGVNS